MTATAPVLAKDGCIVTTVQKGRAMARRLWTRGQSTLEWVIGAAIILGTLATAVLAWNQGLATKIGDLVQQLTK